MIGANSLKRWVVLVSIGLAGPVQVAAQAEPAGRSNLIVLSDGPSHPAAGLVLDVIRRELPVGVHMGRFAAAEGEAGFCIFSRSTAPIVRTRTVGGELLPVCSMIPVYVDNVAVRNPAALLGDARAADLQSIELVSAEAAAARYGTSDDVLVLWTKGCGPHANPDTNAEPCERKSHMRSASTLLTGLLATGLAWPAPAAAQSGYLFETPRVTLTVRGGASLPVAGDDLHRSFTEQLTLERSDFASVAFGGDLAVRVAPRLDLVLSATHARVERNSSFREWVDANDELIEQTTKLARTPVSLNARFFLTERGRAAGQYAWVPARHLLYVGGGAGLVWYELEQSGWFVDFQDLDIFPDLFSSSGSAPMANVFAGTEWWPGSRLGLTLEGKYAYARARLTGDFVDFDNIDLSGFQITAGLSVRF